MKQFNTLRPRQNGRHFPDDIIKWIVLNENAWIPIKISLKFVPQGPIINIPALVQIMPGADQATSHYLDQWWLDYWRIYASLLLNVLKMQSFISDVEFNPRPKYNVNMLKRIAYFYMSRICKTTLANTLIIRCKQPSLEIPRVMPTVCVLLYFVSVWYNLITQIYIHFKIVSVQVKGISDGRV